MTILKPGLNGTSIVSGIFARCYEEADDRSAGSSQAGTSRLRPGPSDAALPAVSTGGALPLRGRSCHCGDAIFSVFCLGVVLPWAARRPCLLPLLLSLAALCSSARVLPLAVASFC